MGILDSIHGMTHPGVEFVFLHSVASLIGGFWFVLIWLPRSLTFGYYEQRHWVPWLVALLAVLGGIASVVYASSLPAMVVEGQFTSAAPIINILAGVLFLAAVPRFAVRFYQTGQGVFFLFLCLSILFGLSELTFQYSGLWDGGWWLWHVLRLAAFLIALWFVARSYLVGLRAKAP
jgi:hypothetical protein